MNGASHFDTRIFPYTARLRIRVPPMAKPNYSYDKRQRELAKKKKQDEKDAKKRAAREAAQGTPSEDAPGDKPA